MAAINTGPSFMNRLGGQIPGMLNSLGQQYGGNLSDAAKGSSALLGRQKPPTRPQTPRVTGGIPAGQMPGQQLPLPTAPPMGQMPQVNTAPSPSLFQNPYANIFGGGTPGYGRSGNTGITGGLFNRPPGYERPGMGSSGGNMGGMFGVFNRLTPEAQARVRY